MVSPPFLVCPQQISSRDCHVPLSRQIRTNYALSLSTATLSFFSSHYRRATINNFVILLSTCWTWSGPVNGDEECGMRSLFQRSRLRPALMMLMSASTTSTTTSLLVFLGVGGLGVRCCSPFGRLSSCGPQSIHARSRCFAITYTHTLINQRWCRPSFVTHLPPPCLNSACKNEGHGQQRMRRRRRRCSAVKAAAATRASVDNDDERSTAMPNAKTGMR